jgi:hypothetical protein
LYDIGRRNFSDYRQSLKARNPLLQHGLFCNEVANIRLQLSPRRLGVATIIDRISAFSPDQFNSLQHMHNIADSSPVYFEFLGGGDNI